MIDTCSDSCSDSEECGIDRMAVGRSLFPPGAIIPRLSSHV